MYLCSQQYNINVPGTNKPLEACATLTEIPDSDSDNESCVTQDVVPPQDNRSAVKKQMYNTDKQYSTVSVPRTQFYDDPRAVIQPYVSRMQQYKPTFVQNTSSVNNIQQPLYPPTVQYPPTVLYPPPVLYPPIVHSPQTVRYPPSQQVSFFVFV